MVGRYGIEERNFAGEDFLQFYQCNQLSIMNTWFQKIPIHYGTWMHSATKLHHMTDFVVMRSSQRMCCLDVQVMKGANCWTDHCMVRAKLRLLLPWSGGVQKTPLPFAVHKLDSKEMCDNYIGCLEQKLVDLSSTGECTAEECWV